MIFSNPIIKEIQKLSSRSDKTQKISELERNLKELNKIFEFPNIMHLVYELDEQLDISNQRLLILRDGILKDFDLIEKLIPFNVVANYCLKKGKEEEMISQDKFPSWREASLKIALKYTIGYENEFPVSGLDILLMDQCIKNKISDITTTANVIVWQKEYQNNKAMSDILRDIKYIKLFKKGITFSTDLRRLKNAIQNVSNYFSTTIHKATFLVKLEIEEIKFLILMMKTQKNVLLLFISIKVLLNLRV